MKCNETSLYCTILAIIGICAALVCRPVDAKLTAIELDDSDISTVLKMVLAHNGAKVAVAGKYYLIRFEATAKSRLPFDVPYVLVDPKVPRGDVCAFSLY